jgi:hypothetical protein
LALFPEVDFVSTVRRRMKPITRRTMKITTKTKKSNFAIPAAAEAIPPNPNAAATNAMIKNTTAQYSMDVPPIATATHSTIPVRNGSLSGPFRWPKPS